MTAHQIATIRRWLGGHSYEKGIMHFRILNTRTGACSAPVLAMRLQGPIGPACLEVDFEERLAKPRSIPLAYPAAIDDAEVSIIDVIRTSEVGIADLEAVENVIELHSQLRAHALPEKEVLGQRKVLIAVEWATQAIDPARRITQGKVSRRRKSSEIEDREPLIVVVVIDVEGLPLHQIRKVAGSQRATIGEDLQWRAARVLENAAYLPAA